MVKQSNDTFKYAIISTDAAQRTKVRFGNDLMRLKVMQKVGHTLIQNLELPNPMTKPEMCKFLLTSELYTVSPLNKVTIDEAYEKYCAVPVVKVKKAKVVKAAKAPVDPTTKMAGLKARASKKTAETAE
jgi:hypothetical protein